MLSVVPKGPGAASATGHLSPPAIAGPGGGAQGQRGSGGGPSASSLSSAPAPGRLPGRPGCDLRHPGEPFLRQVPGRTGGGQQRHGDPADGLRSPWAPAPSSIPKPPAPPSLPQPWAGAGEPGRGAGGAGMRAGGRRVGPGEHNGGQSPKRLIPMLMPAAA